jgi:hypothetical protein
MLKAYGMSLDDCCVHESLLRYFYFLNKKYADIITLYCKICPNFLSSFVHVPLLKGFVQIKKNAQKIKCFPDMLMTLGGPGNEHKSVLDLLAYIGVNKVYKAIWQEAVRSNELLVPTFDGVTTQAMQSMCNMNKSQMKQLRDCSKSKLG